MFEPYYLKDFSTEHNVIITSKTPIGASEWYEYMKHHWKRLIRRRSRLEIHS